MNTFQARTLNVVLLAGVFFCTNTFADDDFWVGAKAGSLGLGLEATWRPVPYLDVRFGLNKYSFDHEGTEAGVDYNGNIDLSTYYATANLRVPLSPFRVTAGLFSNGNEIALASRDAATLNIGGVDFSSTDVGQLQGQGSFDDVAPYFGAGLDFRLADTIGLNIDAGVLRQGAVDIQLLATGPIAADPQFQSLLETERQELLNDVDDYELYPVVSIGLSVNF